MPDSSIDSTLPNARTLDDPIHLELDRPAFPETQSASYRIECIVYPRDRYHDINHFQDELLAQLRWIDEELRLLRSVIELREEKRRIQARPAWNGQRPALYPDERQPYGRRPPRDIPRATQYKKPERQMQAVRKPTEPVAFGRHWRKRSRLADYVSVKALKKGGLSEAITLVQTRSTGKLRIIKSVNAVRAPAYKELEILKRIPKGYHLNYMVEYAWTADRHGLEICLEYCDMGSLHMLLQDHIRRRQMFSAGFVWHVLHDLGCALAFLHFGIKNPRDPNVRPRDSWDTISHLDIKPENIFLSDAGPGRHPRIVLGDFGCAITYSDLQAGRESTRNQPGGTPVWYAPDVYVDIVGKQNVGYGRTTDIWSIGAVVHAMCFLRLSPARKQLFKPRVDWPCGPGYGRALNEVVSHCVMLDRTQRPHAPEIVRSSIRRQ